MGEIWAVIYFTLELIYGEKNPLQVSHMHQDRIHTRPGKVHDSFIISLLLLKSFLLNRRRTINSSINIFKKVIFRGSRILKTKNSLVGTIMVALLPYANHQH